MSCGKKHILVIDDEPDVRTYLATLLQDNGYSVATADDGEQGWQQVQKTKPDLITLDITMPEQSGVRTYRDLKADDALGKIPVVVITAVGEPMHDFLKGRHQVPNPEGFMAKPIDQEALLKMLRDLLA